MPTSAKDHGDEDDNDMMINGNSVKKTMFAGLNYAY